MSAAYVYRAFNADGILLYVGSTTQLGTRLRAHWLKTEWWFVAKRWTFEAFDTEAGARVAETAAIQAEHPRWNVRDRALDHPDGYGLTRMGIGHMYPGDVRWLTHPNVRVINDGRWLRARVVEVAA